MSLAVRLYLLLAIGAIMAVSASAEADAGTDDAFGVWDAFKPLPRVKREPILGPVGTVLGKILKTEAWIVTSLFNIIHTPLVNINNMIAKLADYLDSDSSEEDF